MMRWISLFILFSSLFTTIGSPYAQAKRTNPKSLKERYIHQLESLKNPQDPALTKQVISIIDMVKNRVWLSGPWKRDDKLYVFAACQDPYHRETFVLEYTANKLKRSAISTVHSQHTLRSPVGLALNPLLSLMSYPMLISQQEKDINFVQMNSLDDQLAAKGTFIRNGMPEQKKEELSFIFPKGSEYEVKLFGNQLEIGIRQELKNIRDISLNNNELRSSLTPVKPIFRKYPEEFVRVNGEKFKQIHNKILAKKKTALEIEIEEKLRIPNSDYTNGVAEFLQDYENALPSYYRGIDYYPCCCQRVSTAIWDVMRRKYFVQPVLLHYKQFRFAGNTQHYVIAFKVDEIIYVLDATADQNVPRGQGKNLTFQQVVPVLLPLSSIIESRQTNQNQRFRELKGEEYEDISPYLFSPDGTLTLPERVPEIDSEEAGYVGYELEAQLAVEKQKKTQSFGILSYWTPEQVRKYGNWLAVAETIGFLLFPALGLIAGVLAGQSGWNLFGILSAFSTISISTFMHGHWNQVYINMEGERRKANNTDRFKTMILSLGIFLAFALPASFISSVSAVWGAVLALSFHLVWNWSNENSSHLIRWSQLSLKMQTHFISVFRKYWNIRDDVEVVPLPDSPIPPFIDDTGNKLYVPAQLILAVGLNRETVQQLIQPEQDEFLPWIVNVPLQENLTAPFDMAIQMQKILASHR